MVTAEISMEEFRDLCKRTVPPELAKVMNSLGPNVRRDILDANRDIDQKLEDQLMPKYERRNQQRQMLLDNTEVIRQMSGLFQIQSKEDEFFGAVAGVRGNKRLKLTGVDDGHRSDERDRILHLMDPETGEQALDIRMLIEEPKRGRQGIKNAASQEEFYKVCNLRAAKISAAGLYDGRN